VPFSRKSCFRYLFSVIALIVLAAIPLAAQTTLFTKHVYKVNGGAVSSDPTTAPNGAILDWVLTYQYNPSPAPPAHTDIRDLLPPSLQYQAASLKVPPSWSGQWFNGSWVSAEPLNATGVGAVTAPNLTPFGAGQTALIPAPPSASISTAGVGGDGYRAIPHNGKIYVINHHINGRYLDCFDAATGLRCPNYPGHVPLTNGTTYIGNNNADNTTPAKTFEYFVGDRIYFAAQKMTSTFDIGVLCADLISQTSCGFTSLTTASSSPSPQIFQGVGGINGKVYVQLPTGKLGCADTSTGLPCVGQPFTLLPTMNVSQYQGTSDIVGTKIYTLWPIGGPGFRFSCFDTVIQAPCVGSWPKTPDLAGNNGNLYRLLNATGNVTGICAHTTNPVNGAFSCYALGTGTTTSHPPSYATWIQTYGGGTLQAAWSLGQAGYYGPRVFNGRTSGGAAIGCYDFGTQLPCPGGWPVSGANITVRHYATVADQERLGCMWSYGDDGLLGSFQASDHLPCGSKAPVSMIVTPAKSYCATRGNITAWDKLYVSGLTLGGGVTATLSLYDGNNPTVPALDSGGNPYAQNLSVTSFPVNLGTGGLGIGYGTGLGNYTSLNVVLTFSGITSNAAWTQNPPPSIEVTWRGDPPEFCFQTTVVGCEDLVVKNQATAVTTPVGGGPVINDTAPNPPFSATHIVGADCPAKLTIVKAVPNAPPFSGTFTFNVTCSTPNGVLQQQLSIVWPNTTVTLPNVPAGSTCAVSESLLLPPLPGGFSWSGVPLVTPAGGFIPITVGGANQVSFTNLVQHCNDLGAIKIEKQVQGAPSGFSGIFTFNVSCWTGTNLITQQAQITYPGQTTTTLPNIPIGSVCNVNEIKPLPPLPGGWYWGTPVYQPGTGQVSLIGTCCPTMVVINRAKYCCADAAGVPK